MKRVSPWLFVLVAPWLSGCLGTEWMTLRLARDVITGSAWQSPKDVTSCSAVREGDNIRVMVVTVLEDGRAWAYGACGKGAGVIVGKPGEKDVRVYAENVSGCALEDVTSLKGEAVPCLPVPFTESAYSFAAAQGDPARHAVLAQLRELMVLDVWLPPVQGREGEPIRLVQDPNPEARPAYLTGAPTFPPLWRSVLFWALLPCLGCASLCAAPFLLIAVAVAWGR